MRTVEEQFKALDVDNISSVTRERRKSTRSKLKVDERSIEQMLRNFQLQHTTPNNQIKRAIDVVLSSIGLVFLGILYPIIAIGIKLGSSGPVIFKQPRTGQGGKPFTCYKFRTMHLVGKKSGEKPVVTQKNDPRVFAFGQWLRKLNLDELPQLINVLKGDMSLVGPRPYPIDECNYWNQAFNDFFIRYAVKPGISGHAQVNGLRGGTHNIDHMRKRLDYDLIYIEKQSLFMDLKIIFQTIFQMINRETGAH
jgi:lipopolysaccharide/colanic/teichoic acid biosynthesis glycosyltransferase